MKKPVAWMVGVNLVAVVAAFILAVVATDEAATPSPANGQQSRLKEVIATFSSEIGILAFLNAGLAWYLFTRREKEDEGIKARQEIFDKFSTAASAYYRAIACLETGSWDETAISLVEERMAELDGIARYFLEKIQRVVWVEFYQAGRDIIGEARSCMTVESRQALWHKSIAELSRRLRRTQKLAIY